MLQSTLRAARPAARVLKGTNATALRALSASAARRSSHGPPPPTLYGPGAPSNTVPTNEEQATGLERLQLLGEMEGIEVFDKEPLDSSRLGTLDDPIRVPSMDVERLVGCTGSPADSHDVLWFKVLDHKKSRCHECGSVYTLDFQGNEALRHAHH